MIVPVAITSIMYAVLSITHPLKGIDPSISRMIDSGFKFSPVMLIPVAVMVILPLFKIKLKVTALISIVISAVLADVCQGAATVEFLKALILGYDPQNAAIAKILAGGGMISMVNIS